MDDPNQSSPDLRHKEKLSPREAQTLRKIGSKLADLCSENQYLFLILGSYDEPFKKRLEAVADYINRYGGSRCQAVLMEEFAETNTIVKFELIAEFADYIVGVAEHNRGGFLMEHGMLLVIKEYFGKSYLLKRTYHSDESSEEYSAMQAGAFDIFEDDNRLFEWESIGELKTQTRELLVKLMNNQN